MIKVPYPHMVLNAHDAPGEEYHMWNTWRVPASESVEGMVNGIATVARSAPEGKLQTLIFNAHGKPGKILIGQGINRHDVKSFRILRGLVKRIWIVACKVAKINKAGKISDGNFFCYRLAQESGAYVKASTVVQIIDAYGSYAGNMCSEVDSIPYGYIDNWEPPVRRWDPKGAPY